MRIRTLAATALSVMLTGVLAACGAGSGNGDAARAGTPRISYWATNMSTTIAEDEQILAEQLAAFTADTGIEVDVEVVPWDALWNRILTAVSSGQGPDVLNIGTTWSSSLQATGAFVAFDEETMEAVGGAGKFVETSMAATGPPGATPVAIPLYGQSYGLYYNTALFEEAGITEPPATWEEFVDVGQRLTRDTDGDGEIDQWGVALLAGSVGINAHFAFILGRQNGGALFDEAGNPSFDSDEQVAAVRRYIDLMATDEIVSPGNAEFTRTEAASEFAQGNAAMLLAQSTTRSMLAALDFHDYRVAEVPVPERLPDGGREVQTMVAGVNLTVFEATEHREAALELVRYLTDLDAQVALNHAFGTLPVITDAYQDEAFADESTQVFGDILRDHAEPFPQVPEVGQMELLVGGAIKDLFADAATATVSDAEIREALVAAARQLATATES